MKDHPIIFTTPMVQAILADRKTQTRRVIKPQPNGRIFLRQSCWSAGSLCDDRRIWDCPYGESGDLLWVRETWGECIFPGGGAFFARRRIAYKADGEPGFDIGQWHSPYHLFKRDARLWLEVVKVQVDRVQNISAEEAIAEGMVTEGWTTPPPGSIGLPDKIKTVRFPIGQFADYWNSLNAKRGYGWEQNPWVWVIEFKRVDHAAAETDHKGV